MLNTKVNGTNEKGKIPENGVLTLRLYYDKILEHNFNINLKNQDNESGLGIENTKYDISIKYGDGEIKEYKNQTTNGEGNIVIPNIAGKSSMTIYIKQTSITQGYEKDETKHYVGIRINADESGIELYGNKSEGIIANTEEDTLYIVHQNSYINKNNMLRITVKDKKDADIAIPNVQFEVTAPNGITSQIETDEDGIAKIEDIVAPGIGDFLYEIEAIEDVYGYSKIDKIYLNITFDENGMISGATVISGDAIVNVTEEIEGSTKNEIADIDLKLQRSGTNGPFGDYTIKVIEKDVDTDEFIEGVRYKLIQKATTGQISHITTTNKTTLANGEISVEAMDGEKLLLRLKRSKVPEGYKFDRSEFKVEFQKNAEGNYELVEPKEGVTINNEEKVIIINRTNYLKNSQSNTARTKVNNTLYITKVDENLRPLRDVVMELRENSTGAKWKLKTDSNGLAKLTDEDIINQLGSVFPQHLTSGEGKLTFWITEESVPVGYERIDTDIGFEAYYEYTPEGVLEISYMNVLDGLSYYHIVDQEYDQYETEDYTQVDIRLKVINPYGRDVDPTKFKTIEIEKVDAENNLVKLANATFKITVNYPEFGGMTTSSKTNKNGILNFSKLYFPEGKSKVEIVETTPPSGYALDKTPIVIEVENNNGQINVTSEEPSVKVDESGKITLKVENVKQEKVVPYSIVIEKRDSETDELIEYLTGFNVTISQSDVKNTYSRTTRDGTTSVSNLNGRGTIKIEVSETSAPIGYKKQSGTKTITINKQNLMSSISLLSSSSNVSMYGNTIYVTMYNEKDYGESTWVSTPILEIKKVDNQNRDLGLKKAKFKITMPNGTRIVETLTRGNAALYLTGAVSGRYIIEEINAPSGYETAKKIALDITFDEYKNIRTCEIVQGLGDEYATSVIQKNASGKRIFLKIGDSRIKGTTTGGDAYSLHIDKVSSNNYNSKLNGAKFDISISQQNGTDYHLTKTTSYNQGIYVSGLYGTGKIVVTLRETKSPSGYEFNGQTKKIVFTRDAQTKRLVLVDSELVNISRSDISFNTYGNMITIRVKNKPISYTPIIGIDEPNNPGEYNPGGYTQGGDNSGEGEYNPADPNYGKPYNSIIIENEYIQDHSVKIRGTTFEIYRLGSYISKGTTDVYGLTRISLGNTEYFTQEDYLIKNVDMQDKSYIRNKDVILRITYGSNGKMLNAEIISGKYDDEGRIAAQIDPDFDYVGENVIKIDIRCDKKLYTSVTGTGGGTGGGTSGTGGETGGGTIKPTTNPKPEGNIPSPIKPITGDAEPDFGILLEKVHLFNEKIKVKDAQYAIYVYNEQTGESTSKITKTNSKGQILFGGLLGYGNFTITIVEALPPAEYLLDENRHTIRINRDETSQLITLLDENYNQNLTAKVDNINKIVNVKIKETPSSVGIAIQKQDYDDDLITLKNAKFEITDVATSEKYELVTGEEGIEYINLPVKPDGTYTFKINEIEAPSGYKVTSGEIRLNVRYLDGIIADATIDGENEYTDVTRQDAEYIELNVLNKKIEEGLKYDIELIKADAYYSSITFKDAKIKLEVDNENGLGGVVKTSLTDADGRIYLNNIYGNGKATIKITEIEPPPGRRFDTKSKQVVLNINKENSWIKLDNCTSNVDTYIDNDTKKVKIRIRNYPDGTFIMGANKVDANDHNIILTGAKYSVKLEGGNDLYEIKDYKDGLMALQDIPIPNMSGTYTYTITEVEAPIGYILDTTPIKLKIEVSLINGIKTITNAYVESGNGEVEKYGDEYVHLLLFDNLNTSYPDPGPGTDPDNPGSGSGYTIDVLKVDKLNYEYKISNTLINVHVEAESGENYYKEIRTDESGKINLNSIRGTGRIQVTLTEIDSASKYIKDEQIKIITFTRDRDTGKITLEKVEGNGIISNVNGNHIELIFENNLNGEVAKSITVKKIWNDEKNKSKRPESIKLQIKNEQGEVVASKVVDKTYQNPENSNEWVYVFSALDKLDENKNIINYTISEAEVNEGDLKFYAANYDEESKTITNTFRVPEEMLNEKTNIIGHKVWVDTDAQKVHRPENLKIQLKKEAEVIKEETITTEGDKDITFTDVKKYDENGDEIVYTISETEVNTNDLKFYVANYDEESKTITNTFRLPSDIAEEKISITGHKVWVDTEIQKEKRPTSIKIQLKKGTEVIKEETITTDMDKDITFTDVKKYDENGNEIKYIISEAEINTNDLKFYVASYDEETKTLTNTFRVPSEMAEEKISITGHKVWKDTEAQKVHRPENLKVQLKKGTEVIKEETITTDMDKDITFTDVKKYDENGDEIVYTISETEVNTNDLKFYVASYDEESKTITNTFRLPSDIAEEKTSIAGHKVWVDTEIQKEKRPTSIEIQLKKGAEIIKEEIITTESNKDITFTNVPKYDENGNEIKYIISEVEVNENDLKFYVASYDEETKTLTNTFTVPSDMAEEKISIIGHKVWIDTDAQKVHRPENLKIQLKKGTEVIKEEIITTEGNKDITFTNVPKYDENGDEIVYTISETEVNVNDLKFYVASYDEETKTITNTFRLPSDIAEEKTSIIGHKVWVDTQIQKVHRPESIKIQLKRENEVIKEETITTEGDKDITFTNVPKYDENGNEIVYTISETEVNENDLKFYVASYDEKTKTITNTFKIPEEMLKVTIQKVIKGTTTGLEGANITLIDEENNEYTATTNQEGFVTFVGVQVGKTYKYKETRAPLGYDINQNEYSFRMEEDGTIVDVVGNRIIEDERIKVSVSITKYEKDSTIPLLGAEIGIYGENGQLVETNGKELKGITNKQGSITFIGLEPGTYYYKEIKAPIGYLLNENSYKFIVKEDGNIEFENDTKGILYNEKHIIDVQIKKVAKGTDLGLSGAQITLIDEENHEYTATTNQEGFVTFVGVQVGKTYKYKETGAPLGYTLNENEYSFRVEENGTIVDITGNRIIENERIKVNVDITKREKGSSIPLKEAEIGIYGEDGQLVEINGKGLKGITSEEGKVTFIGLEPGTYYYKEITPPIGYLLNENSYKFTVKEDGSIEFENDTKGIIYNERHLIDVQIRKVAKGTNIGIPGAKITLIDESNNEYTAITNQDGYVTFVGVQVGKTYRYKETSAPLGYTLNENEYSFRVEANEIIVDVVGNRIIENERIKVNVDIIKYEEGSTIPIEGAEIGIYDNNGNLLVLNGKEQKGTTNEQGKITFIGLEPGTYYYKEIKAPIGYLLNENSYKFIVKENGSIEFENDTKGILYNEKHVVNVTIKKVVKGTNIGIPGAEITLIDEANHEYKATTNQDGFVTFVGLQLGKTYRYKETKAPLGYTLNENEYSFQVEENGTIVDITGNRIIENERIKVDISIIKYEEGTTTKLSGAEIGIYDNNGKLLVLNGKEQKEITNEQGKVTFIGLEPGTYYYKEITPPSGYELNKNSYKFIIKEDGSIEFENDTKGILYNKKHTIDVQIRKVIKGTNIGIPGAEITLIDEKNKEYKATTNQDGYVTFVGLQVGKTYYYKETKAPVGYKLNSTRYSFTVKEDETILDIEGNRIIENEKITGSVEIVKYKYGTVVALQGAEIGIYDNKGKLLVIEGIEQKAITNKQGKVVFSKIEPGTYYYKEITPPIGYKLNNNSYKFVINNLGEVIFEDATNGILYNDLYLIEVPIRKIDGITKLGIPGVEITLTDGEGNKQTAITNSEGYVTFVGLQVGKEYTYKETKAVAGYEIDSNSYKFVINADGTVTDIDGNRIIVNYPTDEEIKIPIWKIDGLTKLGLAGVEITLTDEEGNKQTAITNSNGYVTFAKLKKGMKYTYEETKALNGYLADKNKYSLKVEIDGTIVDINGNRIIENYPIASVKIRKIDAITKLGVSEAVIGLFDEKGNPLLDEKGKHITKTTDSEGYVTFKNLPIGKIYYYKEIESPVGYILNNNTYSFKIDTNGTVIDIDGKRIIENHPIVGEIEIFKTEAGTSKYLANTKIAIYNYESYIKGEDYIEELTTNTDGKVHFRNLPVGKYICKETVAPDGYNLDSKPLIFEINKEGKVVIQSGKVVFENTLIPNTPNDEPTPPNKEPDIPSNTEPIPDFVPDSKIPQTGEKAVGVASVILLLTLTVSGVETVILYKRYKKAKEYERMKQNIRKM